MYFIADFHSLTTIKDPALRRKNTLAVAACWIAFGFDTKKHILFCQSHRPEVTELTWYLGCFTPYPMLANAHSFKDKSDRLADVNAGLFYYPVLMAADILLYDINVVPVGKDQVQHLEIARDIASAINYHYQQDIFVLPEASVDKNVMTIPGTDGQKMSKSYNNTIDIFLDEKRLRKTIMGIKTDSTPLEEPKNPETCTVFKLYSLLASTQAIEEMRANYLNGNYGYGTAKQTLFELIMDEFKQERAMFNELMANEPELDRILHEGAEKAKSTAEATLTRVKKAIGF
jgi:tryptophanyl-tRNA synthetase